MESRFIGRISELMVQAEFSRAGYNISAPVGHESKYDLIVDDNTRSETSLKKVQIKTGHKRDNIITFKCNQKRSKRSNGHKASVHTTYLIGDFDLLAVYCPELEKVFVIPVTDFDIENAYGMCLRLDHADAGMYAWNYELQPLKGGEDLCKHDEMFKFPNLESVV